PYPHQFLTCSLYTDPTLFRSFAGGITTQLGIAESGRGPIGGFAHNRRQGIELIMIEAIRRPGDADGGDDRTVGGANRRSRGAEALFELLETRRVPVDANLLELVAEVGGFGDRVLGEPLVRAGDDLSLAFFGQEGQEHL